MSMEEARDYTLSERRPSCETKGEEAVRGTVGQKAERQPADSSAAKKAYQALPIGRSIGRGACIMLGDLAYNPRCTVAEWFGPYIDAVRKALPASRGYFVIPKVERMENDPVPDLYVEVHRMVSLRPLVLNCVMVMFGTNEPAGGAFVDFIDIVEGGCSVFGERVLERDKQQQVFWLGFMGRRWNFGVQRKGQEIKVLSTPSDWTDLYKGVSYARFRHLVSVVDEAFPQRSKNSVRRSGLDLSQPLVLMKHYSKTEDCKSLRASWNGPWIELLSSVFPGQNGYVIQPEAVDVWSAKDPPLLKVIKAVLNPKVVKPPNHRSSLRTALIVVSRGSTGPLPGRLGDTIDYTDVTDCIKRVLRARIPRRFSYAYGYIHLPVYWIYAAGQEWVGGVVRPKERREKVACTPNGDDDKAKSESDSDDDSEEESSDANGEDAFEVAVLTQWSDPADIRRFQHSLRYLAKCARAL